MVYVFNHNKNDACYNMEKHWKHPQWKKPYRKSHPDHTHLVHFKSMKIFNMWESPSDGSRKRKLH